MNILILKKNDIKKKTLIVKTVNSPKLKLNTVIFKKNDIKKL